jgi:chromosome segregation ATPase
MTDIDTVRRFIENTSDEDDPMAHEALKALARLQQALNRLIDERFHALAGRIEAQQERDESVRKVERLEATKDELLQLVKEGDAEVKELREALAEARGAAVTLSEILDRSITSRS